MKVDIIKRTFTEDKEYSVIIGLNKELVFSVYSIPDFTNFYTGKDEKEAFATFDKHTKDLTGETESHL